MAKSKNSNQSRNEVSFDKQKASRLDSGDIDNGILRQSEESYIKVVQNIVDASIKQLNGQNESKKGIREKLLVFFMIFLGVQITNLTLFLLLKGFVPVFNISDEVILAFIGSVFLQTLSAVIIMIKFAFDSKQENVVLQILHGAIEKYQKY